MPLHEGTAAKSECRPDLCAFDTRSNHLAMYEGGHRGCHSVGKSRGDASPRYRRRHASPRCSCDATGPWRSKGSLSHDGRAAKAANAASEAKQAQVELDVELHPPRQDLLFFTALPAITISSMTINDLIGNHDEFPILANHQFFNHAGVSPIPRRAAMALVKYAGQAAEHAYLDSHWFKQIEQLRSTLATLIGAQSSEIAFIKNTSEGLSLVANGLDFHPGDRIVTTAVEYPSNIYPWMDIARREGVELVRVEEVVDADDVRRVPLEHILSAAEHPKTRLITLSHVEFGTGQRHDLKTIGHFCRSRDIRFCVDAIQSIGVLPVDVAQMNIDFLSADGHKWMLGPEGAGFFYCRKELIAQMHPALIGWLSVQNPLDFDHINFTLKSDATRFECGSHNVPGLLALKASIDLIAEIGIPAIWTQVQSLTAQLVANLRAAGLIVVSPRENHADSGIVSFTAPDLSPASALRKLQKDFQTEIAHRAGRLRASPHFYNTAAQLRKLVASIDASRHAIT